MPRPHILRPKPDSPKYCHYFEDTGQIAKVCVCVCMCGRLGGGGMHECMCVVKQTNYLGHFPTYDSKDNFTSQCLFIPLLYTQLCNAVRSKSSDLPNSYSA